jgi:hypothetical protein
MEGKGALELQWWMNGCGLWKVKGRETSRDPFEPCPPPFQFLMAPPSCVL